MRRAKGLGDHDLGVVADLRAHQRGRLQCALERAGDDQIELNLQGVQVPADQQALLLAFLVEGTFDVDQRIRAADSGAGMTKDIKVHGFFGSGL